MSDSPSHLPPRPSLEQLRKQAKERLADVRRSNPDARLAEAQFALAREYGFESWPKLVAHVEATGPQTLPRLTEPVSRLLGTKNVERAVTFWRDVLGFEVRSQDERSAEVVSGEARIRLGTDDWEPYLEQSNAPGTAIVFFETDDVDGLRKAISDRGGQPSNAVNVNWLKVRMFEVRDDDGHRLWFGRSYHAASAAPAPLMMESIMPELPFNEVASGVRHYRDVLGFHVNYEQDDIGVLDRDEVRVLLIARTPRHTGIGSAYLYVRDVDALYTELLTKGADVQGEPVSQPWGLREFVVLDLEGNRLTFGKPFE